MTTPKKSIMRSLGEFTGHILKGIRTPASTDRQEVRRTAQEETQPDGVVLRRTVVEEIELPPDHEAGD